MEIINVKIIQTFSRKMSCNISYIRPVIISYQANMQILFVSMIFDMKQRVSRSGDSSGTKKHETEINYIRYNNLGYRSRQNL